MQKSEDTDPPPPHGSTKHPKNCNNSKNFNGFRQFIMIPKVHNFCSTFWCICLKFELMISFCMLCLSSSAAVMLLADKCHSLCCDESWITRTSSDSKVRRDFGAESSKQTNNQTNKQTNIFRSKKNHGWGVGAQLPQEGEFSPWDWCLQGSSLQVWQTGQEALQMKIYWNVPELLTFCRMKELVTSVEQILPQIEVSS